MSGRSTRPTWSTKTRVAPSATARPTGIELTSPPSRKCSTPNSSRPAPAGAARAPRRWPRSPAPAGRSRTSARRSARCWPRTLERAPRGRRRWCRRTPRPAARVSGLAEWMWVPVETARRTVRSGRSPYTSRDCAVWAHRSVSRSITGSARVAGHHRAVEGADAGAEHQVGGDAALEERPEHADLDGTEDAAAAQDERGRHDRAPLTCSSQLGCSSGCSARIRCVARCSAQKDRNGTVPQTRVTSSEGHLPAGAPCEQEGGDQEDHVEPPVRHAEVLGDRLAELLHGGSGGDQLGVVGKTPHMLLPSKLASGTPIRMRTTSSTPTTVAMTR